MPQVDHDDKDHTALRAFNDLWQQHFAADCLLVFSTGRSRHLYEALKVRVMRGRACTDMHWRNRRRCLFSSQTCSFVPSGRRYFGRPTMRKTQRGLVRGWCVPSAPTYAPITNAGVLSQGWDGDTVRRIASTFSELEVQQESEQRPFKASYHLRASKEEATRVLNALEQQLQVAIGGVTIADPAGKSVITGSGHVHQGCVQRRGGRGHPTPHGQ